MEHQNGTFQCLLKLKIIIIKEKIYNKVKTNYSAKPRILAFISRLRSQTDIYVVNYSVQHKNSSTIDSTTQKHAYGSFNHEFEFESCL